ncbi:AzlC family ABC transporter permease [Radicibacter daui]|uniref:AzlC family ABC transporter permease n=1 Tax=Radicibacter daui TaxID=3064829 RepID=UPI004046AFEC
MSDYALDYGSPRGAALMGLRHAMGSPLIVLGASYVGFGSLVRSSGIPLPAGLLSTILGWALPGQVAAVELYGIGASLLAIMAAVALVNVRMMPMVIALMPFLRRPGVPRWQYVAAAHLIAVTSWVNSMQRCPQLPPEQRMPYMLGIGASLWSAMVFFTWVGYAITNELPASVSLGLVFLNPLYFMLVLVSDLRQRARALAIGLGAVAGPFTYMLSPEWGLLFCGFGAGTLAFAVDRLLAAREATS